MDEQWVCAERENDNYFSIYGMDANKFPVTGRCTSITGQVLGFSIERLQYKIDMPIKAQYRPFLLGEKLIFSMIPSSLIFSPRVRASRWASIGS